VSGRVTARGRDLASVVEAFLGDDRAAGTRPPDGPLVAAAPGPLDTGEVLAALRRGTCDPADLALAGPEAPPPEIWDAAGRRPVLAWCPRGDEADALGAALALGRVAARIRPASVLVLWHPDVAQPPGREPVSARVGRASALARRAAPGVPVRIHCVGWTGGAAQQIADVGKRFA
jgi:hypothetical protein